MPDPGGDTATTWVSDLTCSAAATPPKRTSKVVSSAVPVMVTLVPPPVPPTAGDSPLTIGGNTKLK